MPAVSTGPSRRYVFGCPSAPSLSLLYRRPPNWARRTSMGGPGARASSETRRAAGAPPPGRCATRKRPPRPPHDPTAACPEDLREPGRRSWSTRVHRTVSVAARARRVRESSRALLSLGDRNLTAHGECPRKARPAGTVADGGAPGIKPSKDGAATSASSRCLSWNVASAGAGGDRDERQPAGAHVAPCGQP